MNIYLLKRDRQKVDWDEYEGFVVRATNEEAAQRLIHHKYEDEYEITLIATGVVGEPSIILEAFNAG